MLHRALAIHLSAQRWLPYKFRRSAIKRIYPLMLEDFPFDANLFDMNLGVRFRGNIINYIDRLIYFCGAHEKYMLCLLRDYVQMRKASGATSLTFADIGANAGNHSLFMSRLVDQVYAFEPFERVRKQLEENISLNGIANITVYPFGLSNENQLLPFYAAPESNLGAASFQPEHKADNYYLGDMQLKRGDDVVMGKIDIIKADIEGYEKFALQGLAKTLHRDRPLLIIELSPTTRKTLGSAQAFLDLFPDNYHFYYFASGNYNTGRYRLESFDYSLIPRIQDVICCPAEYLAVINK